MLRKQKLELSKIRNLCGTLTFTNAGCKLLVFRRQKKSFLSNELHKLFKNKCSFSNEQEDSKFRNNGLLRKYRKMISL